MLLQEHVSLGPYTTFGIGGPARWFVEATDEASVLEAVRFARGDVNVVSKKERPFERRATNKSVRRRAKG